MNTPNAMIWSMAGKVYAANPLGSKDDVNDILRSRQNGNMLLVLCNLFPFLISSYKPHALVSGIILRLMFAPSPQPYFHDHCELLQKS